LNSGLVRKFGSVLSADLKPQNLLSQGCYFTTATIADSYQESQAIAEAWSSAELVLTSGLGHERILHDSVIEQTVAFRSKMG